MFSIRIVGTLLTTELAFTLCGLACYSKHQGNLISLRSVATNESILLTRSLFLTELHANYTYKNMNLSKVNLFVRDDFAETTIILIAVTRPAITIPLRLLFAQVSVVSITQTITYCRIF